MTFRRIIQAELLDPEDEGTTVLQNVDDPSPVDTAYTIYNFAAHNNFHFHKTLSFHLPPSVMLGSTVIKFTNYTPYVCL